jgi:hypothetical protein
MSSTSTCERTSATGNHRWIRSGANLIATLTSERTGGGARPVCVAESCHPL